MIPCSKRFFKTYKDSARFIPLVHVTLYGANDIMQVLRVGYKLGIMFVQNPYCEVNRIPYLSINSLSLMNISIFSKILL